MDMAAARMRVVARLRASTDWPVLSAAYSEAKQDRATVMHWVSVKNRRCPISHRILGSPAGAGGRGRLGARCPRDEVAAGLPT